MPRIIAMPGGFTSVDIRSEASAINQRIFIRPGNNAAPTDAAPKLASQHQ
ncbi:hypothetical protein BLA15816_03685 [Burkholderia lata]|uniref:Uncharacterized protein n=1 Tax=Burkholderia lata (strain ATCC 17760 / DSM 23089 / LMG 22485 / NCIMB 9086 / R18194 / 383) TaxID=482957 RepID=A0A6P2R6N5_BURL3|nr:hypothetical protein BLA15816_03685 [Burkholderia lata]VWC28490.1 hypothetical protein BLA15945_06304 [Burkholderia lata]